MFSQYGVHCSVQSQFTIKETVVLSLPEFFNIVFRKRNSVAIILIYDPEKYESV